MVARDARGRFTSSGTTRISWNLRAFEAIRRSPGVDAALRAKVDKVLAQVGPGYVGHVEAGRTRSRGAVVTATGEAMRDNAENHTLVRALSNIRGG